MATPSEPDERGCGGVEMLLIKRHNLSFQAAQKCEEHRTSILPEPRCQHHRGFE